MRQFAFHGKDTYKWWVLVAVSIGNLTVSLDNSILASCLPQLVRVFRTDPIVVGWVNIAYLIASQSFMLTFAKIGDEKGRKLVYLTGMAFYTTGMIICSLSQGVGQLIFARALQGIGAATTLSLSMAIAVAVFPVEERGKTLGILAGVYSMGLVMGPVMGGFILDLLGWRAVFYTRIPLALISLIIAWIIIKEQKNKDPHFRFDLAGSISLCGLLTCILLFLSFGGKWGFRSASVIVPAFLIPLFLFFFMHAERYASSPVINISLFKKRSFTAATLSATVYTLSASAAVFLVPFYLIEALGSSGSMVGIYMGLLAAPVTFISPISGRLSDKIGATYLSASGMLVNCLALYCLSRLDVGSTFAAIGIGTFLHGCGMGIFSPPNNSSIMSSVPKSMLGTASAIATTARQIGVSSGIAISGAIYNAHKERYLNSLNEGLSLLSARKTAAAIGFHDALMVGLAIGIVGVFICLLSKSRKTD